ncbi:hypothetical protein ACFSJW_04860 [Flavobacterium artemisiae]|uniref:Uncharacterized protein n=1 Tax=Flavobacterium artemisiae TaxID=2126556 RepID=A0ABW4HM32_9FLAO
MKIKGSWCFDLNDNRENNILLLKEILSILFEDEILIPEFIVNEKSADIKLRSNNFEGIFEELIAASDYISERIYGRTIIYNNLNKMEYNRIIEIEYRLYDGLLFSMSTYSDIWLPMVSDTESHTFNWNLENYNCNYFRLNAILQKIDRIVNWSYTTKFEKDNMPYGLLQAGYHLFLSPEVITREFHKNPNPDFDLTKYLEEINSTISLIDSGI